MAVHRARQKDSYSAAPTHRHTQAALSALCRRDSVSVGGMLGSKCYYSFLCAADGGAATTAPPDAESIIIILVMELHGHFP